MEFKKEPAILIATHGPFCEGIVESAKMIFGNIQNVERLPLKEGMDAELYKKDMEAIINKYDGDIVILLDIVGGTPYNTVMKLSQDRELCALVGVNFPMLFSALELRMTVRDAQSMAESLVKASVEGTKDMMPELEMFYKLAQDIKAQK